MTRFGTWRGVVLFVFCLSAADEGVRQPDHLEQHLPPPRAAWRGDDRKGIAADEARI